MLSDLNFAHQLADAAARVSLSFYARELRSWAKDDGSLATEADLAVEDELRAILARERPADSILGEERGASAGEAGNRRWILDAIDGTVFFARGDPDWGTLIALEVDGEIAVGVCDQPVHKRRYWAARGSGAFRSSNGGNPELLRVSTTRDLANARSFVSRVSRSNEKKYGVWSAFVGATRPQEPSDHPALEVAFGGYDLALFLTGGPWDVAAPALIVEEAGGQFSSLAGERDIASGATLFTNGQIHAAALALVK